MYFFDILLLFFIEKIVFITFIAFFSKYQISAAEY